MKLGERPCVAEFGGGGTAAEEIENGVDDASRRATVSEWARSRDRFGGEPRRRRPQERGQLGLQDGRVDPDELVAGSETFGALGRLPQNEHRDAERRGLL